MVHHRVNWRMKARHAALVMAAAILPFACFDGSGVQAQGMMRSPGMNIGSRMPSMDRSPNLDMGSRMPGIGMNIVGRVIDLQRAAPGTRQPCGDDYRDNDPRCFDRPVSSAGGGGATGPAARSKNNGPRRDTVLTTLDRNTVANELVAEIDGSLSEAQANALARRHGLVRLASQNFPLIDRTVGLFRVTDPRRLRRIYGELAADANFRSVQPNFRYFLVQQKAALTEGDPAQYAVAKLRLPEAHTLARGTNVTVAVIDSGIDVRHPELAGAVVDSFDALGSQEGPHLHGTGIAGAIAAHARLMGSAPAARILAIRAFGGASNGAESTSFVILKALDYAASHGAQIINMSFAGPKDGLIERGIAAVAAKSILMVAASGNAGPKSPPLYPAANINVIAVSATDAQDKLFVASNRGSHIAVSAPGADIFLPIPDGKYQMISGTSFSAAYVSGVAALVLERNPALKPEEVRGILMKTARDLGTPGRDDLFGAGEADAFAAVSAVAIPQGVPVAAVPVRPVPEKTADQQDVPATLPQSQPAAAAMASDKSAAAAGPAAQ